MRSILILLCLVSLYTQATTREELNQMLRWQHAGDDYLSISAGDKELLVLRQPFTSVQQLGVAILLNEEGESAAGRLQWMADSLNQAGWTTYSLALPRVYFPPPQDEQSQSATSSAPDVPESLAGFAWQAGMPDNQFALQEALLIEQLQALRNQIGDFKGFLMVISEGVSAAWMTKLIAENRFNTDALVAIGPYWPHQQFNQQIPTLVRQLSTPLLDIQSDRFNSWSMMTSEKRQTAARQTFKVYYRQRHISVLDTSQPAQYNWLAKEIHGWVRSLGW